MTEMTVLNGVAIEELLTIPMAVEAVEQAYLEKSKGDAALWPMVFHEFDPGHADLDIKSGDLGGLGFYGLKVVSWFGANPGKGLPALSGTSLLFDLATGAPRALLNAGPITDFRTGAAGSSNKILAGNLLALIQLQHKGSVLLTANFFNRSIAADFNFILQKFMDIFHNHQIVFRTQMAYLGVQKM